MRFPDTQRLRILIAAFLTYGRTTAGQRERSSSDAARYALTVGRSKRIERPMRSYGMLLSLTCRENVFGVSLYIAAISERVSFCSI
jgi:hypothetical protein